MSGPPNMQAIPAAINNFKGQVFRGVINNGKNAPSTIRYPTEFGYAVNKLLDDRSESYNEVIGNLADALQAAGNDNNDISSFFASYAPAPYPARRLVFSVNGLGKMGCMPVLLHHCRHRRRKQRRLRFLSKINRPLRRRRPRRDWRLVIAMKTGVLPSRQTVVPMALVDEKNIRRIYAPEVAAIANEWLKHHRVISAFSRQVRGFLG
ncbi:MAG: hypothetical protein Q9222_000462 [Ikaeria aurantiellina]